MKKYQILHQNRFCIYCHVARLSNRPAELVRSSKKFMPSTLKSSRPVLTVSHGSVVTSSHQSCQSYPELELGTSLSSSVAIVSGFGEGGWNMPR